MDTCMYTWMHAHTSTCICTHARMHMHTYTRMLAVWMHKPMQRPKMGQMRPRWCDYSSEYKLLYILCHFYSAHYQIQNSWHPQTTPTLPKTHTHFPVWFQNEWIKGCSDGSCCSWLWGNKAQTLWHWLWLVACCCDTGCDWLPVAVTLDVIGCQLWHCMGLVACSVVTQDVIACCCDTGWNWLPAVVTLDVIGCLLLWHWMWLVACYRPACCRVLSATWSRPLWTRFLVSRAQRLSPHWSVLHFVPVAVLLPHAWSWRKFELWACNLYISRWRCILNWNIFRAFKNFFFLNWNIFRAFKNFFLSKTWNTKCTFLRLFLIRPRCDCYFTCVPILNNSAVCIYTCTPCPPPPLPTPHPCTQPLGKSNKWTQQTKIFTE